MPEVSRNEIETRQSVVVDNHSQYCSIVRTSIGSNSIVVAGEVDGGELSQALITHLS